MFHSAFNRCTDGIEARAQPQVLSQHSRSASLP